MYTFILVTLIVLALFGIVVGVVNDAVNFLNSALGAKVAPYKVILTVAAAGILLGTLTSNGMMEVARSGVFYPSQFDYTEIMLLFLGVMIGNILLLDIFNNLGLPTSTTVSLVFGLLGAAMAITLYKVYCNPDVAFSHVSQYINSGKAMVIISAILLSVALSFSFGIVAMYVSRILFSFRYAPIFRKIGAFWCGISFTGILYFAVFNGLKSSGVVPVWFAEMLNMHTFYSLLVMWFVSSCVLWVLQRLGVHILKLTILAGTFSLALSFAGNDLVNFIGVPLAGYESYLIAESAGSQSIMMTELMKPAHVNLYILLGAGIAMILTLFFSKKAMHVTQTELSLSSQNENDGERFGSSVISRGLVRAALNMNKFYLSYMPEKMQNFINSRFVPLPEEERKDVMYDRIRAAVNLTSASILISIATFYKLPLSTTYVVFMVAMGTSLADRAWGRESAVYRITGVMTVISGWFLTGFVSFLLTLLVTFLFVVGGMFTIVPIVALSLFLIIKSNFIKSKGKEEKEDKLQKKMIEGETADELLYHCIEEVCFTMDNVTRVYNRTLVAVSMENRKVLKSMVEESNKLYEDAHARKCNILQTLRKLQDFDVNACQFYVQVVDYLSEVTKALDHITRPAYEHVDNNHEGMSRDQVKDLMCINDDVEKIFEKMNVMVLARDMSELGYVLELRDKLFNRIVEVMNNQLFRIKEKSTSTQSSALFFTILTETKTMVLQSRNLMKAQNYFIKHMKD
ncbi:MAG: inorganic phosphate transporter [Prevotellaceae bacterium]|nr:inorganic phosphate transporter [Prevotellaceae bacterium]